MHLRRSVPSPNRAPWAMKRSVQIGLALSLLFAAPSLADTVYLTNGNSFENVIAQRTAQGVRIVLPYGDLTLPANRVARIVAAESPLAKFLTRFNAFDLASNTRTADWVQLGTWALNHDLTASAIKAALRAAALSPKDPGVVTLMRRLDYRYDPELARWVPYADYLRRRGFVREGGDWLSPQEVARRAAAARQASQAAVKTAQARDDHDTTELLKAAALLAISNGVAQRESPAPATVLWPVASLPGFYGFSLYSHERPARSPASFAPPTIVKRSQLPAGSANYSFYNRPPGSLENANLSLYPSRRPAHPPDTH